MSAEVTAGRSDVRGAGGADQADCEVARGDHDGGAMSGPDLRQVLAEGDVANPVQPVLDASVAAAASATSRRVGLVGGEVGDRVSGLGAPSAAAQRRPGSIRRLVRSARSPGVQKRLFWPDGTCIRIALMHVVVNIRISAESVRCLTPCTPRGCSWGGGRGSCGRGRIASWSVGRRGGRRSVRLEGRRRRQASW
jgi:hypothetical protein